MKGQETQLSSHVAHKFSPLFWPVFFVCAVASLIPLWSVKYLPMVDLPHHAAQVSILRHFRDPAFGFAGQFDINWFTPYAFAYYVALFFAFFFPIGIAVKIVVSLTVIALPLSLLFVLRQTGGDPWWCLTGFPVSFGLNFLWGLFNYFFAMPIGIFCIGAGYVFAYSPTLKNGAILLGLSLLTFFSHGIVFAVCTIVTVLTVWNYSASFANHAARFLPFFLPVFVAVVWYLTPGKGVPRVDSYVQWNYFGLKRMLEIPGTLASVSGDKQGEQIGWGLIIAVLLGGRLRWQFKTLAPLLATAALFYFSPFHFLGHSFIYPRLAVFVLVGFLIWLGQMPSLWRLFLSRLLIVGLVILWSGVLTLRFRGFNREASDYDKVMGKTLPNRNLLALIFNRESAYVPAQPFYHFAAWYQAEKGGKLGYSIAYLYNVIARYKPAREPLPFYLSSAVWSNPSCMNWKDYGNFDYYLVRAIPKFPDDLFKDAGDAIVLEAHAGDWWLFKNKEKFS